MSDWGEAEKKQTGLFDVELKEYFKFIRHEFVSFKDVFFFYLVARKIRYEQKCLL
jgi:hypothetical protein